MEPILNIFLIGTLLVMGIAIWKAWQIIKKGKNGENPGQEKVRALERCLNVIHVCVYILVVILVFRLYLMFMAG